MTHGGQEQGLGLAGFICRAPCLLHQVCVIHMPRDVVETAEHHILALVASEYKTGLEMTPRHFKLNLSQFVFTIIALQQVNQLRRALPLLCTLVFQQHSPSTSLNHTQPNGSVIKHHPIELFAFIQGLAGPLGGLDNLQSIPTVDPPANQQKQQKQAHGSHQWPFRVAKEMLISDGVQTYPGLGFPRAQFEAQPLAGKTQPRRQLFNILDITEQYIASRGYQGQATVAGAHQQAFEVCDIADIQQCSQYHRIVSLSPRHEVPGQVDTNGADYIFALLHKSRRGPYPDQVIINQQMT